MFSRQVMIIALAWFHDPKPLYQSQGHGALQGTMQTHIFIHSNGTS